jgi:hypothetical protein
MLGLRREPAYGLRIRPRASRPDEGRRAANRLAWRRGVDVNIHGRNGRIRAKDSHGNESPRLDR